MIGDSSLEERFTNPSALRGDQTQVSQQYGKISDTDKTARHYHESEMSNIVFLKCDVQIQDFNQNAFIVARFHVKETGTSKSFAIQSYINK